MITFIKNLSLVAVMKYIVTVLILLFLIAITSKIGGSTKTFAQVAEPIETLLVGSEMTSSNEARFRAVFGINPSGFEGFLFYETDFRLDAQEVVLVKVSSHDQLADLTAALEEHLLDRKTIFTGYMPEQEYWLNQASFLVRGNFVFFAVGPRAEVLRNAFIKGL